MNGSQDRIVFDNGVALDLVTRTDEFLGIGTVRVGETVLRNGQRPMFAHIRTPKGVEFSNYRLTSFQVTDDAARLEFAGHTKGGGPMDWMVHEIRPRVNTSDWTLEPQLDQGTRLTLDLKAVTRIIGGQEYRGFSYQYRYSSLTHPIYKLDDRATWEIGGHATGSQFWMRNCFVPSIADFQSAEGQYSTEWYIPDCANPSAFQFLPLQTELQGFSFTASPAGVLVTWATEVAHVRSLFEKPSGQDLIVHWHEHCGDLTSEFTTAPVEVLFSPAAKNRVSWLNAYENVRVHVSEALHRQIGMRRERISTYGLTEEWGKTDFDYYLGEGFPKLRDAGVKTFYIANHFQNNMNTYGVTNFCCTVDYKVSEYVGEDKLKAYCDAVNESGGHVEMWGNTSISTLAWALNNRHGGDANHDIGRVDFMPYEDSIFKALEAAESPWVRNPSNAIEADHYTPAFCVLNLRDSVVRKYWMDRWKAAHDVIGLGGIFLDSSFNLSSDKFHWVQNANPGFQGATADMVNLLGKHRPLKEPPAAILSQYRAHLDLMVEMQRAGYKYSNEDLGVFGTHRHGPGIGSRLPCLSFWTECLGEFSYESIQKAGLEPDDVFFKGLAYRMVWGLYWDIDRNVVTFSNSGPHRADRDIPTQWHLQIIEAYNEVTDAMVNREILPDETGVRYGSETEFVLWAFEDLALPLSTPSTIKNVLTGREFEREGLVHLKKHGVYSISPT